MTEYNSQEVLLNANRHTGYLRVKLDNTQGVFDMSKTYLLSIPIHTSMKSDLVYGADQLIDAYNANIKEYTAVLQDLAKSGNHYRFDTSTEEANSEQKNSLAGRQNWISLYSSCVTVCAQTKRAIFSM